MNRKDLMLLTSAILVLVFISIPSLRQYLYLVMGVLGLVGIANIIKILVERSEAPMYSISVFGVLSVLSLFLSWYLWKNPLTKISIWSVGGLLMGTLVGVCVIYFLRRKQQYLRK